MTNSQSSERRNYVLKVKDTFGISLARFIAILCGVWLLISSSVAQAEFLDRLMIIELLRSGQFQKLEQMLGSQEQLYQQAKIPEKHLEAAYLAFAHSDPELETSLNEWVTRKNQTGIAHLARGMYYRHLGWLTRGKRFINKTPQERINGMKQYFTLARKDLTEAIRIRPNNGIAYAHLINLAMARGNREEINHFTATGLQNASRSFAIRWKYLYSLLPWWSGLSNKESLRQIEEFLEEFVSEQSSGLQALRGFPDYVRGEILSRRKLKHEAILFYQKSLDYGQYYWFSYEQGKNYYYLDQYEKAHSAFTEGLRDRPQVAILHQERANSLAKMGKKKEALEEFQLALQLDSYNPDIITDASYVLVDEGHYQEAIEILEKALTYGSHDEYVVDKLGRVYLYEMQQPANGLEYLKRATELNGKRKKYWYNYGLALYYLNDCQAVYAFHQYQSRCDAGQNCSEKYYQWTKKVTRSLVLEKGCWRENSVKSVLKETIRSIIPF